MRKIAEAVAWKLGGGPGSQSWPGEEEARAAQAKTRV